MIPPSSRCDRRSDRESKKVNSGGFRAEDPPERDREAKGERRAENSQKAGNRGAAQLEDRGSGHEQLSAVRSLARFVRISEK